MIAVSSPQITQKEIDLVVEVLKSGYIVQGPKVKALEDQFKTITNASNALAVNSGTAALHCALHALGIKPGDEVITTPFTFIASANSILMAGATPVFVDIDEKTFNIDPAKIEAAITDKTKAILAVDLYGQPADYQTINQIAKKHNLKVVEDAAQSIGAKHHEKDAGNLTDVATFSLYATKNIMSAEGGVVTTNDDEITDKVNKFRQHGMDGITKYKYFGYGFNYRMTDIHAAIGLVQADKLEEYTNKRISNAQVLNDGLKNIDGIITPFTESFNKHVYHQYTIRITEQFGLSRDEFMSELEKAKIGYGVFYPQPLYHIDHLNPDNKYDAKDFPVVEKVSKEVLSLPVHPQLSQDDLNKIIDTIKSIKK